MLNIYKPLGITPLQLITILKNKNNKFAKAKIAFAGRLDPLAHGVMLLMTEEETKQRDKYLNLDKEYEFEVLFGVSTDSYDVLGILKNISLNKIPEKLEERINQFIKSKLGKQVQLYPPFSSKEVDGKPLYLWARENQLDKIKIPSRVIKIYKFELQNIGEKSTDEVKKLIIKNIKSVHSDFRQTNILKKWNDFFMQNKIANYTLARFRITCSSGTYVRSLANDLGNCLGCGSIAFSILRTKVEKYKLEDSTIL